MTRVAFVVAVAVPALAVGRLTTPVRPVSGENPGFVGTVEVSPVTDGPDVVNGVGEGQPSASNGDAVETAASSRLLEFRGIVEPGRETS
jgi:hypothetical protein